MVRKHVAIFKVPFVRVDLILKGLIIFRKNLWDFFLVPESFFQKKILCTAYRGNTGAVES